MTIKKIVVHISDSPHGRNDGAKAIHDWHVDRGFDGIGYHEVITEHGRLETGRPWFWKGAHVRGHNRGSIGICLIGKPNQLNDKQLTLLRVRLNSLLQRFPDAKVYGHCELDENKPYCPSEQVMEVVRAYR